MERWIEWVFWLSFFMVAYSYICYPLILPLCAALFKKKNVVDKTYRPTVGVVVPVYNEEDVVKKKIENILSFDYPAERVSVWVGSDQSTDRTNDIVSAFDDDRVHLWVAPKRGGKTEILNQLVPRVDADIILFTDANTLHAPGSLQHLIEALSDPAVGGAAGHINHLVQGSGEFEEKFYRTFESRQKKCESDLHSTISAFGGFYAIKKELFKKIPFNAYSNDDVLIPMNVIRQKKRMRFIPEAVSFEDLTQNVSIEFKRRIRIGAGNFQAFFWLLDFFNPLYGWPAFCYLSHKATRWFSPLFGTVALMSLGYLAMTTGSLMYYLPAGLFSLLLVGALSSLVLPLRPTRHLFYFFAMNTALLFGFFRYCGGIKSAAWSRTDR